MEATVADAMIDGAHYRSGGGELETWDAILEVFGVDGLASSVMRYVTRYDRKGDADTDLRKAVRYIDKMIDHFVATQDDDDLEPLPVDVVSVCGGLFGSKGYQVAAVMYLCKCQYDGDAVGDLREARRAVLALLECGARVEAIDTNHPNWPYDVQTSGGGQS